jgi:hypothetical protein
MRLLVEFERKKVPASETLVKLEVPANAMRNRENVRWPLLILDVLERCGDNSLIEKKFEDYDRRFGDDDDYLCKKASLLLNKFDRLNESIDVMKKSIDMYLMQSRVATPINMLIYANRIDEAHTWRKQFMDPDYVAQDVELAEVAGDYRAALDIVRKLRARRPNEIGYSSTEMFALLHLERYKECEELGRKFCDETNWTKVPLVVNFELSRKLVGQKVGSERGLQAVECCIGPKRKKPLLPLSLTRCPSVSTTYERRAPRIGHLNTLPGAGLS